MNFEDGSPALHIRCLHLDLAIKAAWSDQGLVESVSTVCCSNHNHAIVAIETIHLSKQLIDSLLTLIVALPKACTSLASDGINLIDEDDAGCSLLSLCKEISHTPCASSSKDLDELGSRDTEEGNASFTSNCLGQERLSSAWRPSQQSSLWNLCTEVAVTVRVLQEVNNFHELLLGTITSLDVDKLCLHFAFFDNARWRLRHLEGVVPAQRSTGSWRTCTAGASKEQEETCNEPCNGSSKAAKEFERIARTHLRRLHDDVNLALRKFVKESILHGNVWNQVHLPALAIFGRELSRQQIWLHPHHLNVPLLDLSHKLSVCHLVKRIRRLQLYREG
mmetsp:Transcript_49419/g.91157  ORF Transcript_49419/g.91157 Transcript_49419/m.91157 type:complete len:334 (-) Transcript_49419:641-1642(-)